MGKVPKPNIVLTPAHPNNFAYGRVGGRNGQFTDHHIVGSADSAVAVFKNPSRQASSTYIVTAVENLIYQPVGLNDTSYADGNMASNRRAVTGEHHGDWRFGYRNDVVIRNSARLKAWLRDEGIINHKVRHREVSQIGTVCPADLPVDEIWNLATKYINDAYNAPAPQPPKSNAELVWERLPSPKEYVFNKQPTNLWSFNSNTWAGITSVKTFAQNDRVVIYGKVTNKSLNATYLLTEYSFTQKVANGFHQADVTEYVPPAPVKPEWERNLKTLASPVKLTVLVAQTGVIGLVDGSFIKNIGQGTVIDIVAKTTVKGVDYYISSWSLEHGQANGIKVSDIGVPAEPPKSEKPAWLDKWEDIEDVDMYTRADTDLVNLEDGSTVKVIPRGEKIRIASTTEWFGHKYAITEYSTQRKEGRGIRIDDLDLKPVHGNDPIDPAPEQPPIKTIDVNIVIAFLNTIKKLITDFIASLGGK